MGRNTAFDEGYILYDVDMKEEPFDILALMEKDLKRIREIQAEIDTASEKGILLFGTRVQRSVSDAAEKMIQSMEQVDCTELQEVLKDLTKAMGKMKRHLQTKGKSIFSVFSSRDTVENLNEKYKKTVLEVEKCGEELYKMKVKLMRENTILKEAYHSSLEIIKELNIHMIAAGLKKKELLFVSMGQQKDNSGVGTMKDTFDDVQEQVHKIDHRIHDLRMSRMVLSQGMVQIRLSLDQNDLILEKIQSSILNVIPLWKNQVLISMGRIGQSKKIKAQQAVKHTKEALVDQNIEMIKQNIHDQEKNNNTLDVELGKLEDIYHQLTNTVEELTYIGKKDF